MPALEPACLKRKVRSKADVARREARSTLYIGGVLRFLATALLICAMPIYSADDISTPKKPVTDDYSGIGVVDDYRWLEAGGDADVRQWSNQQNSRTRAYLDHLPMRPALADFLGKLYSSPSTRFSLLKFRG